MNLKEEVLLMYHNCKKQTKKTQTYIGCTLTIYIDNIFNEGVLRNCDPWCCFVIRSPIMRLGDSLRQELVLLHQSISGEQFV